MTKNLSVLSLTLITVGSVDSIRNLPAAALVGADLFLYFALAFLFFLLPCAIISCWFSKQSNEGIYGWIKKALGKEIGFIAIWFQWMQNILIYPTFFSFIAGSLLFCIDPQLIEQKIFLFIIINVLIWSLTWINIKGIHLSYKLTAFCSLVGLVIPFILILIIGLVWGFFFSSAWPRMPLENQGAWTALTAIILSFCGIEVAAVHAQDSKRGAFPKAVGISTLVIFTTMLFGSLTLAMLLSPEQLNLISGIPKLFQVFFKQIKLEKMSFFINVLIVIGCIGSANNWLISPIKGLLYASKELNPLMNINKMMTIKLLLLQAGGVSLISALFLLLPSINSSYWIMITLATQMYLLMYILMFIGAIKLAWLTKTYKDWAIILTSVLGLVGVSIALIVSFNFPPTLKYFSPFQYVLLLIVSLLLITLASISGRQMLCFPIVASRVMDRKIGQ